MEDAELCKPPGWVEDAEHLFQLSLRCTRWCYEDGTRSFDRGAITGPLRALPRIPQWPRIMHMTLAEQ